MNLVINKEALVTEVADKVVVIEDEEETACPKEITSTAPTTLVSKI